MDVVLEVWCSGVFSFYLDSICLTFYPSLFAGLKYSIKAAMGRIHAIQSDGTIVMDVEAFRKLYEAVDLGWVYAITKYEPVATIADVDYTTLHMLKNLEVKKVLKLRQLYVYSYA
ncbi:uncharacterized protein At5g50100, mitochondrial-like [Olea europaea var. sylvestris]|uniref:uncharacterized protein At5g50100, mitochondrial-like n=1 Tax=Olea europaea var. sylvestris TaxID=158386 RepID=UPI000C1D85A8|nr:uncharacterized protein At5g50100, mitochondrial-like [Olea europaea var. sylvestris]